MTSNGGAIKQEPMDPGAIREVLMAAQKRIQAKQQELNFTIPAATQQRLAELKGRIANQIGNIPNIAVEERDRPVHVMIDKEGRTIDSLTGEVLQIPNRLPTLKANLRRAQKKEPIKREHPKSLKEIVTEHPGLDASAAHFDARIGTQPALRNSRKLEFNKKGKYEEIANRQRTKAKLEILQQEIAQISKKTGIGIDNKVTIIQPKRFFSDLEVPEIEWWDSVIIEQPNYANVGPDGKIPSLIGITSLIEHPIQLKPPFEPNKSVPISIHLTKREQRKMRRQSRAELLKEQQEKIRLGLIQAPEPKIKISNMMRILCSDVVQDPTKIEEYVRNQMDERIRKHEETNAARKLTKDQRREKKIKQATEDTSTAVHVAVYRVHDFQDPAKRFKVETNGKQLHMTGCVINCEEINVVVVEGGPKQQKKFRRLMLHRIKWNSSKKSTMDEDEPEDSNKERNKCVLVWEGTVKDRSFGDIRFKQCPSKNVAREYFRRHGVEHYWDIGQNAAVLESSID